MKAFLFTYFFLVSLFSSAQFDDETTEKPVFGGPCVIAKNAAGISSGETTAGAGNCRIAATNRRYAAAIRSAVMTRWC